MSSSGVNLENLRISLNEIIRATQNFSPQNKVGEGGFGTVYKGQLSDSWQNQTAAIKRYFLIGHQGYMDFSNELKLMSMFHHESIIPFIGYCDEKDEMIIVTAYAINGSLDYHIQDPDKRRSLTWAQRLKICLGAARGLNYLHSGLGESTKVVHRNVKSGIIFLDGNLEAKIGSLAMSMLFFRNQPQAYLIGGTPPYMDPIYQASGILQQESDIYSFGIVLFEILSGMLAYERRSIGDGTPQHLVHLIRRYYDNETEKLIDPLIRDQIDSRSFNLFKKIAYDCISLNLKERPTMDNIIDMIEEALKLQEFRPNFLRALQNFLIPLEEINLATRNFSPETHIEDGEYSQVYRGELSDRWQTQEAAVKRFGRKGYKGEVEFLNELEMISSFHHENIIAFIGYCDEGNEMIIVYKNATKGSLKHHLQDPNKSCLITWAHRLKICIEAARGLNYLHSGLGEHKKVIHRDVNSSNILLDDNLKAKLCGFCFSILVPKNQPHTQVYTKVVGTPSYVDPIYKESSILRIELDVYSFGVVLFEMLSGMTVFNERSIGNDMPGNLINLVRRYDHDRLDKLIDPHIKDEINRRSFHMIKETAYQCISFNLRERPTMDKIIHSIEKALEFQNHKDAFTITTRSLQYQKLVKYLIPLEEIRLARKRLGSETQIGDGGFGVVYKGQLSQPWENCIAAIKCLHPDSFQGEHEFLNELEMVSSFHHENIIGFIGYCDEGNEMIIVSEYASNGSLNHHLQDPKKRLSLSWTKRLKISIGAAKGLQYLHSGLGEENRVIHRDIKSGNILLDENLAAKICDFGLSKHGPRNQKLTQVYTKAAGTNFYLDPIYLESGILRKESDVYSFGVVLFEMLSGFPAYHRRSFGVDVPQPLINLVRRFSDEGGLEKLTDPYIKSQIDGRSFHTFKEIAYKCISYTLKERPTMDTVVEKIEEALAFQVIRESQAKVTES